MWVPSLQSTILIKIILTRMSSIEKNGDPIIAYHHQPKIEDCNLPALKWWTTIFAPTQLRGSSNACASNCWVAIKGWTRMVRGVGLEVSLGTNRSIFYGLNAEMSFLEAWRLLLMVPEAPRTQFAYEAPLKLTGCQERYPGWMIWMGTDLSVMLGVGSTTNIERSDVIWVALKSNRSVQEWRTLCALPK